MQSQHQIQLTDYQGSLFRRFTGKEKDSESGYYYFGARYFMPTLSIWNSVDPMADKYPSLSPYNYCTWNPIKLVDPDGEEVEFNSFSDRFYVFIELIFNKGFRIRYNDLKKSEETYVFNFNNTGNNKLSTDGNKVYINYSLDDISKRDGSTTLSLLRHEIEHAVQFEYGELGFQKNDEGEWRPCNYDINDELKAREFEKGIFNINAQAIHAQWGRPGSHYETREQQIMYLRNNGYTIPDEIWNNREVDIGKNDKKYALKYRERSY